MIRGNLYTIFAPSGAGKTSLVAALAKADDQVKVSVSVTTRPQRVGEQEGVHYFFVDEAAFQEKIADNALLEHAKVFHYRYGTSKTFVDDMRNRGFDVILEIDWQGVDQVKQHLLETISIFIAPPSRQALEERLRQRGQDDHSTIASRMQAADGELSHYHKADYLIINDNFEQALADLQAILRAGRLRQSAQQQDWWFSQGHL